MKYLLLIFFLFSNTLFAQIKVDTSYTIISTFNKEKKKFPFIKMVQKPINKRVCCKKDLVYKTINNRQLRFDVYYKKKNKSQPAVLMIHGGGWKSGDKSQMAFLAQEIANNGYACFCIEYRLSGEKVFPAGILDIKFAIQYIKNKALQYNIDRNKIAVLGCSSGGQMAALVGTTNNNSIFEPENESIQDASVQAIIDMDGILAFHHPESQEGKIASIWLGGNYETIPKVWEAASPLTHCDKNTPPTLFINSSIPRFHAGQDDMIAVLNKFGIYNETKIIPNSPHSFWFFDPWFDEIVEYTTKFLNKIFKNK